ncbi:MAG TPA: SsrA-binding protein, partial [Terricaulis sp.]|nr:SsrA-binding protein [Terricaulis sp.]
VSFGLPSVRGWMPRIRIGGSCEKTLKKLIGAVEREGRTIAPLKLYFNDRGVAKLLIGLAKGKKAHDKRASEKDRDWKRQQGRLLRDRG